MTAKATSTSNRFSEQNNNSASASRFFVHFFSVPAQLWPNFKFFLRTGTARRLILPSLSELGVAPSLQFQLKFPSLKGCGVYCSVTFLWTSPLSDRKVPNSLRQRQQRERNNSKRFIKQTTSLQVHHAFFYISLPLLQEYDGKLPNFTCYGGRKQVTTKFSFSS